MTTEEQIVQKYLELREELEKLENNHKMMLIPLKKKIAGLEEIGSALINMRATKEDPHPNVKTQFGTIFRKNIFNATIEDRKAFLNYAYEYDMNLLDIKASTSGIKEHIERKVKEQAALPADKRTNPAVPGIETSIFGKIVFRKA